MRLKHVGADAFNAQRSDLLARYDHAINQGADDPVKVEHGIIGEAIIREWLGRFLPKKFGVTKGFIITHNLEYDGPVEEWDLIVFDRLESPVLYVKPSPDSTTTGTRMAIPVEHVRAVIEVKAKFRRDAATKVRKKLEKLRSFYGSDEKSGYPKFLQPPFVCTSIFFETDLKDYADLQASLDCLTPLALDKPNLTEFLVLRSQTNPDHCGYAQTLRSDSPDGLGPPFEVSTQYSFGDGSFGALAFLSGWNCNNFQAYFFDLLAGLNGTRQVGRISSWYGADFERPDSSRLFESAI